MTDIQKIIIEKLKNLNTEHNNVIDDVLKCLSQTDESYYYVRIKKKNNEEYEKYKDLIKETNKNRYHNDPEYRENQKKKSRERSKKLREMK